jgi:hypothetical protein
MKKTPSKLTKPSGHLPSPPRELKEAGRTLWSSIIAEFVVDDAGSRAVLKEICQTADMVAACREQIAREGLTVATNNGGMRDHPLTRTLLMSQSFMTRSLIRLGAVADNPKNPVGRPVMGGRGVDDAYRKKMSRPETLTFRTNGEDA